MSTPRANRTSTAARRRRSSWLRVDMLESRITPSWSLPDLNVPHPASNTDTWPYNATFDYFVPPVQANLTPAPGTPVCAEYTRIGKEGDTIAITGDAFSTSAGKEFGSDTEFIAFGQQADNGNKALPSPILRLDGPRAAVTLPDGVDEGLIMVWPRNANGVGSPVRIGAAETWWVGPDKASMNETVSIYGENLARLKSGSTTEYESWVYYETPGGDEGWINPKNANPYKIDFDVPNHLELGTTSMTLWVHNGRGDKYGWSDPKLLTIQTLLASKSSTKTFTPETYDAKVNDGVNDSKAIQDAIDAANLHAYTHPGEGATVKFAAGSYDIADALAFNKQHITLVGTTDNGLPTGVNMSILRARFKVVDGQKVYPTSIVANANNAYDITFRNLKLVDDEHNLQANGYDNCLIYLRHVSDISFENVDFIADTAQYKAYQVVLDFTGSKYLTFTDCNFITHGVVQFYGGASQIRVDGCVFEGVRNVHSMLQFQGGGEASVTNCQAKDYNYDTKSTDLNGYAHGRFIRGEGGFNENIYLGNNQTFDLAPATPSQIPSGDTNAGEQINFEVPGPSYYGKPTSMGATYVGFADVTNYMTEFGRTTASIVDGKGIGQRRKVTGISTNGVVTVKPAWNVIPDATSTISLAPSQQNVVVYDNDLDGRAEWMTTEYLGTNFVNDKGTHVASSALQVGGVAHFVVVKNRITDVRQGIVMIPNQHVTTNGQPIDQRPQFDSDFFNYFADNRITNAVQGVAIVASPDPFANGFAAAGYGAMQLGTTVRYNHFFEMQKSYVNQGEEAKSFAIGVRTALQYRAADLTIIEDNEFPSTSGKQDDFLTGVYMDGAFSPTTFNTIIRNNDFVGLNSKATGVNFAVQGTPALFGNNWGNSTPYAGNSTPGPILELSQRVVRLDWSTGSVPVTIFMHNAGTGKQALFDVMSDSSWLKVNGVAGFIVAGGKGSRSFDADLTGLGNGTYTATVTVIGAGQTRSLSVEATVTGSSNIGPSHGLPSFRPDRVTTLEAEYYDLGGVGKGYGPDANDHVVTLSTGQTIIQQAPLGDWYNYTVNVAAGGLFRVEGRLRGNGAGGAAKIEYAGGGSVTMYTSASGQWETIRPVDGSGGETFMNLAYGLQTLKLNMASTVGPDIDWIRFMPVDAAKVGLTLPYQVSPPIIWHFGPTTIQTEHYNKGGKGVAYSDLWSANNSLSNFRVEDNVSIDGTGPSDYAVRGIKNRWQGYTINVANPGKYRVAFRLSAPGDSSISIRNGSNGVLGSVVVGGTGGFTNYNEENQTIVTLGAGVQSIHLWNDGKNSVQVDWLKFAPVELSVAMGPIAPTPSATDFIARGSKTHVGAVFAVNAPGYIDALRFFVREDEYDLHVEHIIRIWRVASSSVPDLVSGQAIMTADTSFAGQAATFTPTQSDAWATVGISPVYCTPGLYVVSVDVFADNLSASTISQVAPPATPSVLTLVAGSVTGSPLPGAFPDAVYFDPSHPTTYFWLDVSFTPMY